MSLLLPLAALAPGPRAIRRDLTLQIDQLLARHQADPSQRLQVLLGLGEIPRQQIGLAGVLVSAAMLRVERERTPVVLERWLEAPEVPVGEAEIVVQVGVVGIALDRAAQAPGGFAPLPGVEGPLSREEVRIRSEERRVGKECRARWERVGCR